MVSHELCHMLTEERALDRIMCVLLWGGGHEDFGHSLQKTHHAAESRGILR